MILKGILDVDDAKTAVKLGADAVVVSNHGGRQLDGAPSSISALPAIADAVGSDTEVLFDGGIRTGADIMRALALGARACMIGRAYIYGLGAGGQAGVAKAIDILEKELSVTMALTGTNTIADIGRHVLVGGGGGERRPRASANKESAVPAKAGDPKAGLYNSLLLQPIGQRVAGGAVIFVRQEFAGHAELTRSPLGSALRVMSISKSIADMMPSPNSSSISAFSAGPLTRTNS